MNQVKLVEVAKSVLSPVVEYPPSSNPMLMEKEEGTDGKSREETARAFVHRFGMLKGQRMVGYNFMKCMLCDLNFSCM